MGLFILIFVIIGAIVVVPMGIAKGNKDYDNAPIIDCPVCGKEFRLIRDSYKCPKCKTRIVKTEDGELKVV